MPLQNCILCSRAVKPPKAFICDNCDADGILDKAYRKSKSLSTVESFHKSLELLFAYTKGRTGALKIAKNPELNIYEWFDDYVAWLQSKGMRGGTVRNRVGVAKKWFKIQGLSLSKEKFHDDVVMPKPNRIPDVPITIPMLRQTLTGAPLDLCTYITIIASSGRRGGEVAQYKWSYVHLEEQPTRIIVPASITKTDLAQDIFVSDEATDFLKQMKRKYLDREYIFYDQKEPLTLRQIELLRDRWNRWLTKVNLAQKLEEHPYHIFHPHSIGRKFFFSRVVGIIGETAAHALMGHAKWYMTYYQRSLEQRRGDYLRAVPDLLIFKPEPSVEQRKQALMGKAVELGFTPRQMKELETGLKEVHFMTAPELEQVAELFARHASKKQPKGETYEVVQIRNDDEEGITKLLSKGFEFAERVNGHRLYRRRANKESID